MRSFPSKQAVASAKLVRAAAAQAMAETQHPGFGDDNVGVAFQHDVREEQLRVWIWSLGPRPAGKTGRKRDLQNLQEVVLDAAQGVVFDDDNQVDWLLMQRVRR